MARSRKSSFRRRRRPVDWVQNFFTYAPSSTEMAADSMVLIGGLLVMSKQVQVTQFGNVGSPQYFADAAWAHKRNVQRVKRVVGHIFYQPTETWTSGGVRNFAMRILKVEVNPDTADIVLNDPGYTLNANIVGGMFPYIYADQRFLWEKRHMPYFNPQLEANSTRPIFDIKVDWRGTETLEDHEGLAIIFQNAEESPFGSPGPIRLVTYLRTLVEVES